MIRRQFLAAMGLAPAAASANSSAGETAWREAFPRALKQVYLDAAAHCPLSRHTAAGIQRYLDFHTYGPGDGRGEYVDEAMRQARGMFARMINATPSEIALVQCTKGGENVVVNGLDIQGSGGNVVTNDLHYAGSIHSYIGRRRHGMDVRIVKARDWAIDLNDMDAAIDGKTRLVAITLVSNVNGHIENAAAISEMAHARGAYVYADIIQAAGVMPIDVKALGVDFAACSNYKWLQGVRGAGYLYVRQELQGKALKDLLYPGYVVFNYRPWVASADASKDEFGYRTPEDAQRYEPGNHNYAGYAGQYETFKFMESIGIEKMFDHTMKLVNRIRKELPESRYRPITPPGLKTPVVTFMPADMDDAKARVARANIQLTLIGNRMRISPAIFNTENDVDRLLEALT
ncbi:MAG: aminotransferase class V-fold PLP-dependent enzyme [Bryobacteraceae bacterium]|nr:aminotransferase class V-fold PLP-dependent enzyme [Bryobacteraceae bacterium]